MKKILFGFCMLFPSCTQSVDMETHNEIVEHVNVSFLPIEHEINSRLELTDDYQRLWELNDVIGIFPNVGGQVEFPVTQESVGTASAKFNGGAWGLKSGYFYSAYYPYNFYNRNAEEIPFSYEGQSQDGINTSKHLSRYLLGISSPTEVVNGALGFKMNLKGCIMRLYLTLPEATTYTSLELYADSEIIPVEKTFNILQQVTGEKVVSNKNCLKINLKNFATTSSNQEVLVWAVFPSMDYPTKTLSAVVKDSQGNIYVGKISRVNPKDGSYDFYLATKSGSAYRLKASPVLTDGMQGTIESWITEVTMTGTATQQ